MTYAIIGAGHVGNALARNCARAGLDVTIANSSGPETILGLGDRRHSRDATKHLRRPCTI